MANTYAWTINKLDVRPTQDSLSDVVYNVHWSYTATSDQLDPDGNAYTETIIGTSPAGDVDPDDFTAFADLTESQVQEWINADLSIANIQESADATLNEKITPSSERKDVPW